MGQQTNKVQKRRRRADYLARKKAKLKQAIVAPAKPKVRKAPAKKKEPAAAIRPAEAAPAKTAEPAAKPAEAAPVDVSVGSAPVVAPTERSESRNL